MKKKIVLTQSMVLTYCTLCVLTLANVFVGYTFTDFDTTARFIFVHKIRASLFKLKIVLDYLCKEVVHILLIIKLITKNSG